MKRPRILLDIDGVSADFVTPCLEAIEAATGVHYLPHQVTSWDIMESLGLDDVVARQIFKSMERPGLCLNLPTYEGAAEGVASLREWADVWAVTSPFGGDHWMHERDAWLVKNLGFVKDDVLHVRSARKHGVVGDAFVEDKTETLRTWAKHHPTGHGVLFQRRYNENDGWEGTTARDWPGIVAALETLLRPAP